MLASIVKYAHELIGSDLTYLSVFDTDGNLTQRASEGAFSSGFRNARVPANTGVAARVVESAAPYWVSDYLSQDDLIHDAEFDKVVADEGLKALLGVPLRASGAVIGILYAADRYERPFRPEEVAMFSAFSDHAVEGGRHRRRAGPSAGNRRGVRGDVQAGPGW